MKLVAAVIVTYRDVNLGNMILLVQRGPSQSYPMHWALPGGKIEVGESANQAARRELYEETGIDLPDLVADNIFAYTVGEYNFMVFHFHLALRQAPVLDVESVFAGYGWFQYDKPWPVPNGPMLTEAILRPYIDKVLGVKTHQCLVCESNRNNSIWFGNDFEPCDDCRRHNV